MRSIFVQRPLPSALHGRSRWFWAGVWLPALLSCCVIAAESTGTFSAEHTSGWMRPFLERLLGPFTDNHWWWAHHLFRKSGHFLGYGLVGLTFLRAWRYRLARQPVGLLSDSRWRLYSFALGVACASVVASADEYHQTFLPSRTGGVADVLLDTCGALLLCGAVTALTRRFQDAAGR